MDGEWGNMFGSEEEFLKVMADHDDLVKKCASGELEFQEFLKLYNGFYGHYALDGHESDEAEIVMFQKFADRILPHEKIAAEILRYVCLDEDAVKQSYLDAGRIGSEEGLRRLKYLANKYFE